jgi:hypothetical protein
MFDAKQARKLTNESTSKFDQEITRISNEIKQRARDGFVTAQIHDAPAEIAQKIADEFCIHGYKVKHKPGSKLIELEW